MAQGTFSRRQFAKRFSAAMGAAVMAPEITKSLAALAAPRLPEGAEGDWIQLNANENPYGPSPKAVEAITHSESMASRYPDELEGRLIAAIAKLHGVEKSNVMLGCGSGEILRVADSAFLDAGKKAVVAEPTFEAVLAFARVMRAEPVKVPLTADHRHDLRAMLAASGSNAGLIYLCNPNNPTGTIVTREELADFFSRAPQHAIVLVDEAYYHFVEDKRYASAFEWFGKVPNLVIARTFSKIYGMAGMRLGYAVAAPNLIRAMSQYALWNRANTAVLEAALACLGDEAHIADQRKKINGTREWLCKELEGDGRRYIPSHANFVMVDVGGNVEPLIHKFEEKRILVGRKFPSMGNWLRISVGTPKEMQTFVETLRALAPAQSAKVA